MSALAEATAAMQKKENVKKQALEKLNNLKQNQALGKIGQLSFSVERFSCPEEISATWQVEAATKEDFPSRFSSSFGKVC